MMGINKIIPSLTITVFAFLLYIQLYKFPENINLQRIPIIQRLALPKLQFWGNNNHRNVQISQTVFGKVRNNRSTACPSIELKEYLWVYGKWPHIKINSSPSITIVGAHYDDRPVKAPVVRVFAAVTGITMTEIHKKLKCEILFNSTETHPAVVTNIMNAEISKWKFLVNGSSYLPVTFACSTNLWNHEVKSQRKPCHVNLAYSNVKVTVPVTYPRMKTGNTNMVGICVGALYGHIDEREARALVEWVEINLMFGVSEINMYNSSVTVPALVQRVLDFYKSRGILTWTDFPPPMSSWQPHEQYDASIISNKLSLSDCVTRNRLRYAGALVHDFDELVVPKKPWSQIDITKQVNRNDKTSIGFPSRFVFLDVAPSKSSSNSTETGLLIFEKFPYAVVDYSTYSKVLVLPKRCVLMWPHNCLFDVDNNETFIAKRKDYANNYPPKTGNGTLYHFRRSCSRTYTDLSKQSGVKLQRGNSFGTNCEKLKSMYKKQAVLSELSYHQAEIKTRVQKVFENLDLMNAPHY